LRCFAKYVLDNGLSTGNTITVSTLAGIKTIETDKANGKVTSARVNMGSPNFTAEDIPVDLLLDNGTQNNNEAACMIDYMLELPDTDIKVSLVSIGNPHAVAFINENIATYPLLELGPGVENYHIFPHRINFEIARIMSRSKIEARVWERGVGETLACGSGACAIAVAAQKKELADEQIDIMLPGGTLTVYWDGVGEIYLSGPVEKVFTGVWE
jgi:diaminopimelate epimerase